MGVGRRRTPKKGRAVTRDFVWRHCYTLKWAGMLSKAPTAVHLLGRIQAGWRDICFPLGQMKQNSGFFVLLPFGGRKKRQICCWVIVQWAHKHHIKTDRPVTFKVFVSVSWYRVTVHSALMAKPKSFVSDACTKRNTCASLTDLAGRLHLGWISTMKTELDREVCGEC